MTFGQKLKELRERKGLTQAGLSKASDVPLGSIRDYEQDKREPLLTNAQKLARALDVSLDVFPFAPEADGPSVPKRSAGRPPKSTSSTPLAVNQDSRARRPHPRRKK